MVRISSAALGVALCDAHALTWRLHHHNPKPTISISTCSCQSTLAFVRLSGFRDMLILEHIFVVRAAPSASLCCFVCAGNTGETRQFPCFLIHHVWLRMFLQRHGKLGKSGQGVHLLACASSAASTDCIPASSVGFLMRHSQTVLPSSQLLHIELTPYLLQHQQYLHPLRRYSRVLRSAAARQLSGRHLLRTGSFVAIETLWGVLVFWVRIVTDADADVDADADAASGGSCRSGGVQTSWEANESVQYARDHVVQLHQDLRAESIRIVFPTTSTGTRHAFQPRPYSLELERLLLREASELIDFVHSSLNMPVSALSGHVPRAVLICGPHGVGKSNIVDAIVREERHVLGSALSVVRLDAHRLLVRHADRHVQPRAASEKKRPPDRSKRRGEPALPKWLRQERPTLITIDNLDALCAPQDDSHSIHSAQRKALAEVLTFIDEALAASFASICVIGISVTLDSVDRRLLRSGRFDRVHFIAPPNSALRSHMAQCILDSSSSHPQPGILSSLCRQIGEATPGYVLRDLVCVCREALLFLHSPIDGDRSRGSNSRRLGDNNIGQLEWRHVQFALSNVSASARNLTAVSIPKRKSSGNCWDDIGGLAHAKRRLRLLVSQWSLHCDASALRGSDGKGNGNGMKMRLPPIAGLLLCGPPGTGKTLLANAVASEQSISFVSVQAADLFSKYLGESERSVRVLFQQAAAMRPCVLFIDEIDSIGARRSGAGYSSSHSSTSSSSTIGDRVLATLLNCLDGIESRHDSVFVIGATNRASALDPALTRPGRLEQIVELAVPSIADLEDIFRVHCRRICLADDVKLAQLARHDLLRNATGAVVAQVCSLAALLALRQQGTQKHHGRFAAVHVSFAHFDSAIQRACQARVYGSTTLGSGEN